MEFLSLKGGCTDSSKYATLLEITCRGSYMFLMMVYENNENENIYSSALKKR